MSTYRIQSALTPPFCLSYQQLAHMGDLPIITKECCLIVARVVVESRRMDGGETGKEGRQVYERSQDHGLTLHFLVFLLLLLIYHIISIFIILHSQCRIILSLPEPNTPIQPSSSMMSLPPADASDRTSFHPKHPTAKTSTRDSPAGVGSSQAPSCSPTSPTSFTLDLSPGSESTLFTTSMKSRRCRCLD